MNKTLLLLLPLLLATSAFATSYPATNTVFNEAGLLPNTAWMVSVYSIQNTTNAISPFTQNTVTSNSITTNTIPNGQWFFIASYNGIYINQTVNVGVNNNFNFNYAPSTNSLNVNNATYLSCISTNFNQAHTYYGSAFSSLCVNMTGSISSSARGLQSQVIGAPFSANLTIYINLLGYFEYIINNGTQQYGVNNCQSASNCTSNNPNYDTIPQSLWVGMSPETFVQAYNITIFNHTIASSPSITNNQQLIFNKTYKGAILYSDLIDISPIEYQMLDGNLTPNNFVSFVQSNDGSFYNTTLVYNTTLSLWTYSAQAVGGVIATLVNWGGQAWDKITFNLPEYIYNCITNSCNGHANIYPSGLLISKQNFAALNNVETSVSVSKSIPIILNGIQNYKTTQSYPLYVSYAYPNTACNSGGITLVGICIQSGQTGMLGFNKYIDDTYEPQVVTNEFLSTTVVAIFGYAMLIYIVKKFNGE